MGKTEWDGLADWWLQEVEADPAYRDVVAPLAMALLGTCERRYILDVGCGDGRLMSPISAIGATPIGIDIDWSLLTNARRSGPTVRAELPDLPFADSSLGGAVVSLVLEHLPGHRPLLDELARVLEPGATLALVINHPMFTAPDSAPIADIDGETLWRPGRYFDAGFTEEPAGSGTIRFYHRTTGDLLTAAADAGFCLEQMIELGPDESQIERVPALAHQRHVPRLLGVRWRKASGHS